MRCRAGASRRFDVWTFSWRRVRSSLHWLAVAQLGVNRTLAMDIDVGGVISNGRGCVTVFRFDAPHRSGLIVIVKNAARLARQLADDKHCVRAMHH